MATSFPQARQAVAVQGSSLVWALVVFFGASLAFAALNNATKDSSTAVSLAVQVGALAFLIVAVVFIVRRLNK
jgi:hypothetical protein